MDVQAVIFLQDPDVGIDLNPDYLAMAARRLSQQSLFALEAS